MAKCTACKVPGECSNCNGKGKVMTNSTLFNEKCKKCGGSGNCTVCKGTGKV